MKINNSEAKLALIMHIRIEPKPLLTSTSGTIPITEYNLKSYDYQSGED